MARPIRINQRDGIYHVTSRGNNRQTIFYDAWDAAHFQELLEGVVERFRVKLMAYVVMGNHYHLLIQTPEANCSEAIQWLNISYSAWYNRRHRRSGHVFQGRFGSVVVENGPWVLETSIYIHLNPVTVRRLGLDKRTKAIRHQGLLPAANTEAVAQRLKTLREHQWSSYLAVAGYRRVPGWLSLEWLEGRVLGGRQEYRKLVEERLLEGHAEGLMAHVKWGLVLGGEAFVERMRDRMKIGRESAGRRRVRRRYEFDEIIDMVERLRGERWLEFRDRHGDWGRDVVLWAARLYGGYKLTELTTKIGGADYTAIFMAIKRLVPRAAKDRSLACIMAQIKAKCEK